jgi:hypothetical protein
MHDSVLRSWNLRELWLIERICSDSEGHDLIVVIRTLRVIMNFEPKCLVSAVGTEPYVYSLRYWTVPFRKVFDHFFALGLA